MTTHLDPLLTRRQRVLGPAYRLFYEEPLSPVRGKDVWLYDAQGKAFLDCYNNVPSVGHCHPRVVDALARQANILNTHTRYLHEDVVAYAESLAALFPEPLDTVMLTCTGSEANDLALRIAHDVTGRRGLIVTENAYHGVTVALADLSPSLQPVGAHVRKVRAPDTYRSEEGEDVAERFASDIRAAVESLRAAGLEPAALMVDTVFASDGIFPEAERVLTAGAAAIREAGGLFIADEVQGGFARTGQGWWAFQREDELVPDMVSLGKPMGAGHPIAGLVLQSRWAEPFGRGRRYFNTFGGNTVSVAVGQAVLQVIKEEDLLASAAGVGAHLLAGLRNLAGHHSVIGDVRGQGLYVGVDLVEGSKTPSAALATRVCNGLRQRGVLLNTSGPHGNVLKIRPPLTFKQEHADQLLDALDSILKQG
ncbi:aminotransferase class III-fold pyridoxal phosphate-dependent enzyme [Herbaspirillum sp. DW155]|uniref:aspartate aminotransferase family protein n=1 Tax=Herbaspirillum sp. DW155 TaxID=3095609 RepID=UPI003092A330|nr:aminotransferase class III-fold pyridoxal phosphate-dependent enzyme [Herbaspirillum sp. DW155]